MSSASHHHSSSFQPEVTTSNTFALTHADCNYGFQCSLGSVTSHSSLNLHNSSLRELFLSAVCNERQAQGLSSKHTAGMGEAGHVLCGRAHLSDATAHASVSAAGVDLLPCSVASLEWDRLQPQGGAAHSRALLSLTWYLFFFFSFLRKCMLYEEEGTARASPYT